MMLGFGIMGGLAFKGALEMKHLASYNNEAGHVGPPGLRTTLSPASTRLLRTLVGKSERLRRKVEIRSLFAVTDGPDFS